MKIGEEVVYIGQTNNEGYTPSIRLGVRRHDVGTIVDIDYEYALVTWENIKMTFPDHRVRYKLEDLVPLDSTIAKQILRSKEVEASDLKVSGRTLAKFNTLKRGDVLWSRRNDEDKLVVLSTHISRPWNNPRVLVSTRNGADFIDAKHLRALYVTENIENKCIELDN